MLLDEFFHDVMIQVSLERKLSPALSPTNHSYVPRQNESFTTHTVLFILHHIDVMSFVDKLYSLLERILHSFAALTDSSI